MSSLTYSRPTLFIGDKEVKSFSSIQYTDSGKNQASSLNVSLSDPDLRKAALLNKEVVFYLNYGSEDTVPFFRGRIKQLNPTDFKLQFTAYDVRSLLTGRESLPLSLTDKDNYDGHTLSQFLYAYIDEYINVKETIIGLDFLNETNPTVSLSGQRTKKTDPMKLIRKSLPKNSTNLNDIKRHRLSIIDDGVKSNICFVRDQSIDSAGVLFTYSDGIKKLTVKKRESPNLLATNVDNTNVVYKHNNLATGVVAGKIEGKFDYPDEAMQEAFIQSTLAETSAEITLDTTKGHYLNIGNVVTVSTPDYPEINGKHRIVSKQVTSSVNNISCKLQLAKESPQLSEYLSSS